MSILRPETVAILKDVRPCAPLFSNMIAAELFDAAHTRGSLRLLPTTAGGYIVFDDDAPLGQGLVEGPFPTVEKAHVALERLAADRASRPDAAEASRAA